MREILELCVELDTLAHRTYRGLSDCSADPRLTTVFEQMATEERQHVDWWGDLLMAWDAGLVPDIADEQGIRERLIDVAEEVRRASAITCEDLSTDDMLELAAHLEFYMLDPVFGELLDLMQPGNRVKTREAYSRHVLRLIETIEEHYSEAGLARFLARVLKRAYRDQQRLAQLAMRDQLTGLYNRRGLVGHLGQWLSWSARYGRPVAVALIDIDNFKRVNDVYGHSTGDNALAAVAEALAGVVRSSDIVGRFGGDEFLVLAPETEGAELSKLMGRMIEAVRAARVEYRGEPIDLSVSCGGAWLEGGVEVSGESLVAQADRSLYLAKNDGRDRAGEPVLVGPA